MYVFVQLQLTSQGRGKINKKQWHLNLRETSKQLILQKLFSEKKSICKIVELCHFSNEHTINFV